LNVNDLANINFNNSLNRCLGRWWLFR